MKLPKEAYYLLGFVAIGAAWFADYTHRQRQDAIRDYRTADVTRERDSLQKISTDTFKIVIRDTLKMFRSIRSTDTVLTHIIDTAFVTKTDTVKVPVQVLVQVRDTLRICQASLGRCVIGYATERQAHAKTKEKLHLVEEGQLSRWKRWGLRAAENSVSFELGRVSAGKFP